MENFKYTFDRSGKKYRCPQCNKKTLVRYIDTLTRGVLSDASGVCDRESKCGYFMKPNGNAVVNNIMPLEAIKKTSYHTIKDVENTAIDFKNNNFIQYLKHQFGDRKTGEAIREYYIGTSNDFNGSTVFWQIDLDTKVRHGKIMKYNADTGKRLKNSEGNAYISSMRHSLGLKDFNLNQTLFGMHLASMTPNSVDICIVESEKTAIVMSIVDPTRIWMACGSLNGVKYDYFKGLENRSITLFPDKGCINKWSFKAYQLNDKGFDITVDDSLEHTNLEDGDDIADLYLMKKIAS
jgi:hypothetical protein